MKTLKQIARQIEQSKMAFGEIPEYSVVAGTKYLYVCRNNGQHHKGNAIGIPGFATFVGKFTAEEVIERFLEND